MDPPGKCLYSWMTPCFLVFQTNSLISVATSISLICENTAAHRNSD